MGLNRTSGSLLENIMGGAAVKKEPKKVRGQDASLSRQDKSGLPGKNGKVFGKPAAVAFVNTREKRSGTLYIRISESTRRKLDYLCRESRSSQATVIESLIDAAVDGRVLE